MLFRSLYTICNILGYNIGRSYTYHTPGKLRVYESHLSTTIINDLLDNEQEIKVHNSNSHVDKYGIWYKVRSIDIIYANSFVYNLEVEDDNTYCVDFIAVHNCKGPSCFMADKCMMQEARCAPLGSACPIEKMLIDQWEKEIGRAHV